MPLNKETKAIINRKMLSGFLFSLSRENSFSNELQTTPNGSGAG